MNKIVKLLIALTFLAVTLPPAVKADVKLQEVVVTATRHEEKTTDVPAR